MNLAIRYHFTKVLPCQLLIKSEVTIEVELKFTKVYFANCNLGCDSPNFSPAKVSLHTVPNTYFLLLERGTNLICLLT